MGEAKRKAMGMAQAIRFHEPGSPAAALEEAIRAASTENGPASADVVREIAAKHDMPFFQCEHCAAGAPSMADMTIPCVRVLTRMCSRCVLTFCLDAVKIGYAAGIWTDHRLPRVAREISASLGETALSKMLKEMKDEERATRDGRKLPPVVRRVSHR